VLSDLVLVAAVVAACVFAARGTRWAAAIECAFPLLGVVALCVSDERTRFLAFGVIVAAAFAAAALVARETWLLAIAGVALLRWIPLREVEAWRELVVLGGAVALFFALTRPRAGALTLIATLAVAAVTPVHPGKAALFPLALAALITAFRVGAPALGRASVGALFALAAPFVRWSLVPICVTTAFALLVPFLDTLKPLAYAAALALFALWPWSGVVARALPVVKRFEPPAGEVRPIGWSLPPGAAATVDIEPARHLVVNASMANSAGMPGGRVVGLIDAGRCTRVVRIGDVADFGFTRRPHFFAARNPLPRVTRGDIRDYGAAAWLHGAGAIGIACGGAPFTALRFRAAADLPAAARLQIESIELPAR
jgi:hypothetical protein